MGRADGADGEAGAGRGGLPFLKLSAVCGLDRWKEAQPVLGGFFRVLVDVLEEGSMGAADRRGR
jgi:hypothetical protein